jgi:flavin-dependent dehydrogenase
LIDHRESRTSGDFSAAEIVDVLIIGGGPAGTVCSLALKQAAGNQQRRVVVVERERFPRFKVCGCCFNGAGAAALRSVGCGDLLREIDAIPLDRWEAHFRHRQIAAGLPTGWAASREALDQALLQKARSEGVEVLQPATARIIESDDSMPVVEIIRDDQPIEHVRARVVVVASGLAAGPVEKWLPWKAAPTGPIGAGAAFHTTTDDYRAGTIYMACGDQGYAGLVMLENGKIDVAAAIYDPRGKRRGTPIGQTVAEILRSARMPPIPELETDVSGLGKSAPHWKGTPLLHRQRRVGRGRILAIGDSAGYVEPFTGEGMAWAMRTATLAANAIVANGWGAGPAGETIGDDYSLQYRRVLGNRRLPCRLVSKALRHHASRQLLFASLGIAPWMAKPFIRLINSK